MSRKSWTVSIGDWDCRNVKDCHSEKDFGSSRAATAFMFAKANCEVPEKCWIFAGLDGWEWNGEMVGKSIPTSIEKLVAYYIKEENDIENLVKGVELLVEISPTSHGNFLAYCPAMKCELIVKEVSELDALANEYAGLLEAESGAEEGSANVTLKVNYKIKLDEAIK